MRLFNYKSNEFKLRHEYENSYKKTGTKKAASPAKKVTVSVRRESEPIGLELHHYSDSEDEEVMSSQSQPKKTGYERWKEENGIKSRSLSSGGSSENNSKIEKLENEVQRLNKSIKDQAKSHEIELKNRDKYQQDLEEQVKYWKEAFENREIEKKDETPFKDLTERLITHQFESEKRLSYIYEDAKKAVGFKRFREMQDIGGRLKARYRR